VCVWMCEPRALRRSGSPGLVRSRTRRGNTLRSGDPLTATGSEDDFIKAGEPTAVAAPPRPPLAGLFGPPPSIKLDKLERGLARSSRSTFVPMGGNSLDPEARSSSRSSLFGPHMLAPREQRSSGRWQRGFGERCSRPEGRAFPASGSWRPAERCSRRWGLHDRVQCAPAVWQAVCPCVTGSQR
jgi:hypothetical protein